MKEEFSCAYINLISSYAGYEFQRAERLSDSDGIDGTIVAPGKIGFKRRPRFDVQIKCTSTNILGDEYIKYPLKVKNYEELRDKNSQAPQLLIVVLVSEDVDSWLIESEQVQRLNCSSYWMSLRGYPATENKYTETVYLPRNQLFDVKGLKTIMQRIAEGETL